MAKGINKVILVGNLGGDPEMLTSQSGTAIAKFSVATGSSYKDDQGNNQEITEWHSVVAFKRRAEIAHTYLKKGSRVFIEGHLHTNKWVTETGDKRSKVDIVVDNLLMLDGKAGEETKPVAAQQYTTPPDVDPFDDDIPF